MTTTTDAPLSRLSPRLRLLYWAVRDSQDGALLSRDQVRSVYRLNENLRSSGWRVKKVPRADGLVYQLFAVPPDARIGRPPGTSCPPETREKISNALVRAWATRERPEKKKKHSSDTIPLEHRELYDMLRSKCGASEARRMLADHIEKEKRHQP